MNITAYEGTAEILGETRTVRASTQEGLQIRGLSLADCNRIVGLLETGQLQAVNLGNETREAKAMVYDAIKASSVNGATKPTAALAKPQPDPKEAEVAEAKGAENEDEEEEAEKPKRGRRKTAGRKAATKKTAARKPKAKAAPPPEEDEEDDEDDEDEDDEDESSAASSSNEDDEDDDEDEESDDEDEDEDEDDEDEEDLSLSPAVKKILPTLQGFKRVRPVVATIVDKLDVEDMDTLVALCESIKDQVPALSSVADLRKRVQMAANTAGIHK